jgi:hypothetical protein
MKHMLALIGAYLIVGPIYVRRKLAESNYLKIPPFMMRYRSEGGIGLLIATTLAWPLATSINREFGYWAFFAIVAALLVYL